MNLVFDKHEVAFTSDTHFGHANIIKYCSRPFADTDTMDKLMLDGFMDMDTRGKTIFHLGDFAFNPKFLLSTKWRPRGKHYIILGNHDKHADACGKYRTLYREFFHYIIGKPDDWKRNKLEVLVGGLQFMLTHEPHRDLSANQYNIYGHHHNHMVTAPERFTEEYGWIFGSDKHINVAVELTDYKPVTFDELLKLPRV